jgi:alpha-galactosidase
MRPAVRRVALVARLWLAVVLGAAVLPTAVVLMTAAPASALGNGLALTPPMGWNDWNAYGCNVSEQLVEQTALAMHNDGMQAAGYDYVNIDDCWMSSSRAANGNLVPNPTKFPDGMAAVASYVHSLGLKLGIYEDAGTATCAGYPGSYGHEQQDADLFASWGVDYLKYDWCNIPFSSFPGQSHEQVAQTLYTRMSHALKATSRPIVFSMCNGWDSSVQPWTWAGPVANLWRTTSDIQANFSSMLNNFHINVGLAADAGPGAWNDPDMLEVGNGMSAAEDQSEFSLWAEMAAPLIEGSNLTSASSATLSILTNNAVIAVDQDSLGKQGTEVSSSGGLDVLAKPLANGDVAVALFNETGSTATISTTAAAIGKTSSSSYTLTNLWTGGTSTTVSAISASVPAHATVMYRVASAGSNRNTVTVSSPGNQTGTVGTAVSVQIHASDSASGQTMTYSASGLPAGLSVNSSTGLISGTPTAAATSTVTVTATDGTGASGSATFTWTVSGSSPEPGGCHVTYATQSQWAGGFVAQVTIADNGSAAISGWTLGFTFSGDQKITDAWNDGSYTQTGENVTVTNASYNGTIQPGGSTTLGFQGTWNSSDATPTAFTLNGTPCMA